MLRKFITGAIIVLCLFSVLSLSASGRGGELEFKKNTVVSRYFARPDGSVDLKYWKAHYAKHPERWNAVFRFLAEMDTATIANGKTELADGVVVNITESMTREPEKAVFERHEKMIDLQYILRGREGMVSCRDTSVMQVLKPFNAKRDVGTYRYEGGDIRVADKYHYFLFFPQDIHRPCLKVGDKPEMVKKIVFKIPVN